MTCVMKRRVEFRLFRWHPPWFTTGFFRAILTCGVFTFVIFEVENIADEFFALAGIEVRFAATTSALASLKLSAWTEALSFLFYLCNSSTITTPS